MNDKVGKIATDIYTYFKHVLKGNIRITVTFLSNPSRLLTEL